jgi:hypothetical protein
MDEKFAGAIASIAKVIVLAHWQVAGKIPVYGS